MYDAANQLTYSVAAAGRTTYTFDSNGNQHAVLEPNGNRTTTTWDYENQPTLYRLPAGGRVTMAYHANLRRIEKRTATGTTRFIWDDDNYLLETDGSHATQVVYTNEPAQYGNLVSQRRGATTSWYHFDAIGSTRQLTAATQLITDSYSYKAFGDPIVATGTTVNPFRFVGEVGYYYDDALATNYVRARVYQPPIGRWTSPDPLMFVNGGNLYVYANNTPGTTHDPTGTMIFKPIQQSLSQQANCGDEGCILWQLLPSDPKKKWPCPTRFGWVIQKVEYFCTLVNCDKACPDKKKAAQPTITFLEATKLDVLTLAGTKVFDLASGVCRDNWCGFLRHEGEGRFFCEAVTGKLDAMPKLWKKGPFTITDGNCEITGGEFVLHIKQPGAEPDWWKKNKEVKSEAVVKRWWEMHYNCCPPPPCGANGKFCKSDADPKLPKNTVAPKPRPPKGKGNCAPKP